MASSKISALTAITALLGTDEFVVARSGATKKITAASLAFGADLAYVESTSGVTVNSGSAASPNDVLSAGALVFDGSTRVCIEFYAPAMNTGNSSGAYTHLALWDDVTVIVGRWATVGGQANQYAPILIRRYLTPSAGTHTYKVRAHRDTADGTVQANTGGSNAYGAMYIRVTKVP